MWNVTPSEEPNMFLVVADDKSRVFIADGQENADWLAGVLDDATDTIVKLYCQTVTCGSFGGFITRAAQEARKNVFFCDECSKPMVRKAVGPASEKQSGLVPLLVTNPKDGMHPPRVIPNAPRPAMKGIGPQATQTPEYLALARKLALIEEELQKANAEATKAKTELPK